MSDEVFAPPSPGRTVLLTAREVEEIRLGIQSINSKVDNISDKQAEDARRRDDHEARIRALELTQTRNTGGQTMAQWATPVLLSAIGLLLAYLGMSGGKV